MTIELAKRATVDGFTLVQDNYNNRSWEHTNESEYFHDWWVYFGDDPDYTKNEKCPGGPFMRLLPRDDESDESGWVYDDHP